LWGGIGGLHGKLHWEMHWEMHGGKGLADVHPGAPGPSWEKVV
jgi:hypothetical protein